MQTYWIREEAIEYIIEKIEKGARRAKKLDVEAFDIAATGGYQHKRVKRLTAFGRHLEHEGRLIDWNDPSQARIENQHWIEVRVACGEFPHLNGWQVQARIERLNDKLLYHVAPGVTDFDRRDWDGIRCDHCNTRRHRTDVVVVRHENGDMKQVGRNCLADFIGTGDLTRLMRYAEMFMERMNELLATEWDEDGSWGGCWSPAPTVETEDLMLLTIASIEMHGWLSKGAAYDLGGTPTAGVVSAALFGRSDSDRKLAESLRAAITDANREKAARVIEWVRNLDAEELERNEYLHNLNAICSGDDIAIKHFGLACSAVVAYDKAMERETRKRGFDSQHKVDVANSQHRGEIKERLRNLKVEVAMVRYTEGDWGSTQILKLRETDTGAMFVWFNSGRTVEDDGKLTGQILEITGTVKDHSEWNDVKETVLSRCKVH